MYGGGVLWGGVLSGYDFFLPRIPSSERVGVPTVTAPSQLRLVSQRAPLRLSMSISAPDGFQTRWSAAEKDPLKTYQGLTFSTTLPGGFEHCDVSLIRDPRHAYHDLQELQQITIYGVGGSVAWQGRLETIPSASGDQLSISPGAVGYQSALTDDHSAREIYVDNNLSTWQGPLLDRQIFAAYSSFDADGAGVAANPADPVNPYIPALVCEVDGPWSRAHAAEAWYDSQGIPIGYMLFEAMVAVINKIGDQTGFTNWVFQCGLCEDDALATTPDGGATWTADSAGAYDVSANLASSLTASQTVTGRVPSSGLAPAAGATVRPYAFVQIENVGTSSSSAQFQLFWRTLTLVGQPNLPLYDSDLGGTAHSTVKGVLGSDVLKHAIPKYAPEIAITRQGISTIQPSSFVIPHLSLLTPGTVADIISAVSAFELQDWAVWEGDDGPAFYWYPRGTMGRRWRSRIGPAKLQSTGPQIDRLYNGVIVTFSDFAGIARTVGPGGTGVPLWAQSGCTYQDPSLIDLDPENPLNQANQHMRKWAQISMSASSTLPQAIVVGAAFLVEQRIRNSSGSAQLGGYVEDDTGVQWPAWMVRAGDWIAFTDAADPGYRRIVSTSYSDDTRINSITLDSPPDSLQAILSRLQVTLVPVTGG